MGAETKVKAGHANLNAAIVAAQGELAAPRKDREVTVKMKSGDTYKFSYATMSGMIEQDKPVLARHGLGFVQFATDGNMVTRIIHESGEYLDCPLPMLPLPHAPQEAGSIITYFKRYSYAAAFGRVADEEDDANIAAGNDYIPAARAPKMIKDQERDLIATLASATGKSLKAICDAYKVESIKELTQAQGEAVIARLRQANAKEPVNA